MNELQQTNIWASHTQDYSRRNHLLIIGKFLNLNLINILGWQILFMKFCPLHCEGFPSGASSKEPSCQCRRHKRHVFDPWVRKIPWRRTWPPTKYSCLENLHRQRSLSGYNTQGCKESGTTEATQHACTHALCTVRCLAAFLVLTYQIPPVENCWLTSQSTTANDI